MCFSLKPKHRWVVMHLALRVGTSTGNNPYLDRIYIYIYIYNNLWVWLASNAPVHWTQRVS